MTHLIAESEAALPRLPVADRVSAGLSTLRRVWEAWRRWRTLRQHRALLRQLPVAVLIDIGIDPESVYGDRPVILPSSRSLIIGLGAR